MPHLIKQGQFLMLIKLKDYCIRSKTKFRSNRDGASGLRQLYVFLLLYPFVFYEINIG